jgi:hypothetical protein
MRPWARAVREHGCIAGAKAKNAVVVGQASEHVVKAVAPAGVVVPAAARIEHERKGLAVRGKGGEARALERRLRSAPIPSSAATNSNRPFLA